MVFFANADKVIITMHKETRN